MIRCDWVTTRRAAGACAVAATMLLSACGSDDDELAAETEAVDEVVNEEPVETEPAAADPPPVVQIVGTDYSYEGLPETIRAGTTLELRNDSEVELHEVVAVRLPDDEERSAGELLQLPPAEFQAATGPPSAVIIAPPSDTGRLMVGSAVLEEPGRYLLFCGIPTEADPDEYMKAASESVGPPDVPGGPPHFVEGMWAEVTVAS